VCRVAPSFIRLGNFEILAARDERGLLDRSVDFTIDCDFPEITGTREERRAAWFVEVCRRTARLVVEWQRVGFVHGVMNTDNLSILGLTIDYGPYGWLDNYDPDWTPNTTDAQGRRYRFANQPAIAGWNLMAFANALVTILPDHDVLRDGLARYAATCDEAMPAMQAEKFGLTIREESRADDHELIDDAYRPRALIHQRRILLERSEQLLCRKVRRMIVATRERRTAALRSGHVWSPHSGPGRGPLPDAGPGARHPGPGATV